MGLTEHTFELRFPAGTEKCTIKLKTKTMKTFELDKMGVNELTFNEMKELNGGFWGAVAKLVIAAVAGAIGGAVVSQCTDDCTTVTTSCVDENGCTHTTSTTTCN